MLAQLNPDASKLAEMLELSNSAGVGGSRQLQSAHVPELIDPDDLVDAGDVAVLLGLASRSVVSVYRSRYGNFPPPAIERGQCRLWLRRDIEVWARRTGRSCRAPS